MRILILTAPFGSGHLQVSTALVKELRKHAGLQIEVYDLFSEDYPILSDKIQKAYLKTYKPIGRDIYRMLYYTSHRAVHNTLYAKMLKPTLKFGARSLRRKLNSFNPDIIISVFPVTSLYILQRKAFKVPVYTVITDYYANGLWLYHGARRHYIATYRIMAWGLANGLKPKQFKLTGIPVHDKFYLPLDRHQLYSKYGLEKEKRTVLIVAGTHGVLPNVSDFTTPIVEQPNVQVIVVCGKNKHLYTELAAFQDTHLNLHVLGYCQDMHELLELADIMITKPGGISLTEATIKGVPVLLYNPVYGQELENARYFSEKKAGMIATNKSDLIYQLLIILNEEGLLEEMKQNIKNLSHLFSAKEIVEDILKDSDVYDDRFL